MRLCAGLSLGTCFSSPSRGCRQKCVLIEVAKGVGTRAPCSSQEGSQASLGEGSGVAASGEHPCKVCTVDGE